MDSPKAATATKDAYQNAPKKARDKIKALPWRMKDLRAVRRAGGALRADPRQGPRDVEVVQVARRP